VDRISSGNPLYLSGGRSTFNNLGVDGGVVFGNGLTAKDLIKRLDTIVGDYDYSCRCLHTNVSDIQLANGAPNPDFYKPGDTPGVIGAALPYRTKPSYSLDLSVTKEIQLTEKARRGIKANITNFLNHPFRNASLTANGIGNPTTTGTDFGQLTNFTGTRNINLRAYIDF